jgi:hypothetical protein
MPLRWAGHLPLTIRVILCGNDEGGQTFTENTQTVGVDRRGARVLTSYRIALGAQVTLENRAAGRRAEAKVVWRSDLATAKTPSAVIVELIDPSESDGIWGIRFPSRSEKKPGSPSPSPAPPGESAKETNPGAKPDNGERAPSAVGEYGHSGVGPGPRTDSAEEWPDLSPELESLASSFGKETDTSCEVAPAESTGEALAALRDDAERARRNADEAVYSLNLAAEEAAVALRAIGDETQASLATAAEGYDRRLAEQSASSSEKLQASLAGLVNEGEARLAGVTQSCVEQVKQSAGAATEENRALNARTLAEKAAAITRSAESAAQSIQLASEEALAKLQQERAQAAGAFKEQSAAVARSAESAAQSVQPPPMKP